MNKPFSDFVFHFTNSLDALVNIINAGFRYTRNAVPQITRRKITYTYRPDMISFTDTPLYQIDNHARNYGSFAVGMKKSWALKAGGQPVMYVTKRSQYYRSIKKYNLALEKLSILFSATSDGSSLEHTIEGIRTDLFIAFDGLHGVSQTYSDYSEREWRIIRDDTNKFQQRNLDFDLRYDTLKFTSDDIVLLVAPTEYIPVLIQSIQAILSTRDQQIAFPIIPFEYIKSM